MRFRRTPSLERCLCIALALLAIAFTVSAQDGTFRPLNEYSHYMWQTEDGLPQNSITSIIQTRDGFIWLGTLEGLVRFDGVKFTVYDKSTSPNIRSNRILTLFFHPPQRKVVAIQKN
jgi:ligand-binding sensor domain-containing protein